MKLKVTLLFLSVFVFISPAFAKVYRCNGMVRHRPCKQEITQENFRELQVSSTMTNRHQATKTITRGSFFSRISNSSFKPITGSFGRWRGVINGNGLVHLHMKIFRNKVLESTRYMGKILLTPKDKNIPFRFEGPVPKGRNWSWTILGSNKAKI